MVRKTRNFYHYQNKDTLLIEQRKKWHLTCNTGVVTPLVGADSSP